MFNNATGLEISIMIALAIMVVLLALILLHGMMPTSKLSLAEDKAGAALAADWKHGEAVFATLEPRIITEAEALAAGYHKIEPTLRTELQAFLTGVEKKLLDTASEDADIAEAAVKTEAAKAAKALKVELVQQHITTLQAAIATPAATA